MPADVVITGFGVFSAFGFGEQPLFDGVFAGRPAFSRVTRFDVSRFRCQHAATFRGHWPLDGEEPSSDPELATLDVLTACAASALDMAGDVDRSAMPTILATKLRGASIAPEPPGALAEHVATRLALGGLRRTFVNACVAGSNAVMHAAQLVRSGACTAALAGGAFLVDRHAFSLFDAALALSVDGRLRPFDIERQGVLLGDAGAALVVESADHARSRGAEPLARVAGWAITDDAFDVVRPEPGGAGTAQAIRQAMRDARIDPSHLSYVNAHGTGTPPNDPAEAMALRSALGRWADHVQVSSTKSTTGHALEGCGVFEVVVTLLALRSSILPPTAGLSRPDPQCALNHVVTPRKSDVTCAMTLNSSVGGLNSAIVLARPQ